MVTEHRVITGWQNQFEARTSAFPKCTPLWRSWAGIETGTPILKSPTISNMSKPILTWLNNTFYLTLSLIRQFCSRRLWTYFVKRWKISIMEWITYNKKLKTLWQKEKLHVLCNFFFCHYVFKIRLLQRRPKASIWGKGLKAEWGNWFGYWRNFITQTNNLPTS